MKEKRFEEKYWRHLILILICVKVKPQQKQYNYYTLYLICHLYRIAVGQLQTSIIDMQHSQCASQ